MRLLNERSIRHSRPWFSSRLATSLLAVIRFYSAGANRSPASRPATRYLASIRNREFVTAGGLVSYGISVPEAYRHAGLYVGRLLRGAKPSNLPVERLTKFEFVINLTTSKRLG